MKKISGSFNIILQLLMSIFAVLVCFKQKAFCGCKLKVNWPFSFQSSQSTYSGIFIRIMVQMLLGCEINKWIIPPSLPFIKFHFFAWHNGSFSSAIIAKDDHQPHLKHLVWHSYSCCSIINFNIVGYWLLETFRSGWYLQHKKAARGKINTNA